MRELRIPSDADDSAIQEALTKLFNAQVQDQSKTVPVEDQANRAKRSVEDQGLKAKSPESVEAHKASISDLDQSSRGGQTFPKSTETRNSVAFHAFFFRFFPSVFVRGGRFGFRVASPMY